MTFVRGTTTAGALPQKLAQLICGEVADDVSTTVAAADRWVREFTRTVTDGVTNSTTTVTSATAAFTVLDIGSNVIGTGIPAGAIIASVTNATTVVLSAAATASASGLSLQICLDTVRTKAAVDVATGPMSNRTGYLANCGAGGNMTAVNNTVARVTAPYSADQSPGNFHRWVLNFKITATNSVSGNYSTAVVSESIIDADNGGTVFSNTARAVNAAGAVVSMQGGVGITLSDPSGFVTVNTVFVRAFSTTYMYGVDHWPMLYRASTTPAFSVAPPGVAGTDYDILTQAPSGGAQANSQDRSNLFHGLGIKTATGLGAPGALYTVSWSMALAKCRIFTSSGGVLSLDMGQSRTDLVNTQAPNIRCVGGLRITTWCKFATTPGSVLSTTQVQYWMSVRTDGIALVLNADPGQTGRMGSAWIGSLASLTDPTYDVFPTCCNNTVVDHSVDTFGTNFNVICQYGYWGLRRRQDGSEGSRDWQTKWMRCEGLGLGVGYAGQTSVDVVASTSTSPAATFAELLTPLGWTTDASGAQRSAVPARQSKPSIDGKWWFYQAQYGESDWNAVSQTADENRFVRGSLSRVLYVPGESWGNGDELTDTGTGAKYILFTPDYVGIGGRVRTTTNTYFGGLAIPEL